MKQLLGVGLLVALGALAALSGCQSTSDATDIEDDVGGLRLLCEPNANNCSNADSLSVRPAPGSPTTLCVIPRGTLVHVFDLHGEWADVFVYDGQPCAGTRGYALKDYLSRSFCH